VALQRAEMGIVTWMCGIKLQDRVPSKRSRERLGLRDIISVLQQNRLRWYGHVLQKEDSDWVMKCMVYEVEGAKPRGRPEKTWIEIVVKDCQAQRIRRMPLIVIDGGSMCIWVCGCSYSCLDITVLCCADTAIGL